MRKLLYLFAFLFLGANFTSCTPETIADEIIEQACCDEGEDIPPPPRDATSEACCDEGEDIPPPPRGNVTGG